MYRVGFAILAVLVAAVFLYGAAYGGSVLAPYLMHAIVHSGRATAIIISIVTSQIGGFLPFGQDCATALATSSSPDWRQ